MRELFWPLEPRRISPLGKLGQRRQVLTSALQAAAALKPPVNSSPTSIPSADIDPWFDQRLADDQWKDPLLLLMAAVIAAASGIHAALKLSRTELAKEMARRERARVQNSAQDRAAKDLLVHLYACVTLCGGLSHHDAATVAEAEFAARKMLYQGGPGQAVKDLATLLGGRNWLPSMTPDLLGEAFLLLTLGDLGPSVVARLSALASGRVAATIVRSVQDFSHWGEPAPMQWAKALVAEGERDLEVLLAVEGALPDETVALRALAVDVTRSLVLQLSKQSEPSERSLAGLARVLNNLSNRQSAMGQRAEALASSAEAVRLYRALAEANPGAFLPNLATSLNNQANRQSDMGQRTEALASIAEVVRHYHALAQTNPDAFLPNLAMSLNNQAIRQGGMGQHAESLASIAEAVRHYRARAEANPDAFLPDLAMSLNTQAIRQSGMGQNAESLASIAEAVRLCRVLIEGTPDAVLPNLAMSLNNQANMQSAMGQRAEAVASIAEAVRHYRALAEANPDAFLPDLATSLSVHGDCLAAMERLSEARHAARESLSCLAPFCAGFPGVFDGLAKATLQDYLVRTEKLGEEADHAVVKPYRNLLRTGESE